VTGAQTIVVSLGPWEGRALLLDGISGAQPVPDEEYVTPIPVTPEAPPMPLEKPRPASISVPRVVLDPPTPEAAE
jgi:hypothetical protein